MASYGVDMLGGWAVCTILAISTVILSSLILLAKPFPLDYTSSIDV